jgi:hypothetical protein
MTYQPGERVALVHTDDPHTLLRPGDEGTVVAHHATTHAVEVAWDNGSRLSMCLDAGDRIHRVATTSPPPRSTPPLDRTATTAHIDPGTHRAPARTA